MEGTMAQVERNLARTQRKLNLLCSWIQLKFGDDPSLPKSLFNESFDESTSSSPVHKVADTVSGVMKEEEPTDGQVSAPPPMSLVAILMVTPQTIHPCRVCNQTFPSDRLLSEHEMGHCVVRIKPMEALTSPVTQKMDPLDPGHDDDEDGESNMFNEEHDEEYNSDPDYEPEISSPRIIHVPQTLEKGDGHKERKTRFNCPSCPKHFKANQWLRNHIFSVHRDDYEALVGKRRLPCPECNRFFDGALGLSCHRAKAHSGISPVNRGQHSQADHPPPVNLRKRKQEFKFEARLIEFPRETPEEYGDNQEVEERRLLEIPKRPPGSRKSKCPICAEEFSSVAPLRIHMRGSHPEAADLPPRLKLKRFDCPICPRYFTANQWLRNHIFSAHRDEYEVLVGKRRLPCPHCHRFFDGELGLKCHQAKAHQPGDPLAPDDEKTEEKRVVSVPKLPQGSRKSKCPICDEEFSAVATMRIHMRGAHLKADLPPRLKLKRRKIGKNLDAEKEDGIFSLEKQKKVRQTPSSTKAKSFMCHICGYSTGRKNTLQHHMDTHSDERRFKCSLCSYTAKQAQALYIHKIRHLGQKWPCHICGEVFKMKSHVIKHVRVIHEGLRAHPCNLCDKKFTTRSSLKYHIKTHMNPGGRQRGLNRPREPRRRAPNRLTVSSASDNGLNLENMQSDLSLEGELGFVPNPHQRPTESEGTMRSNFS